jgi:hypothetical protein
MPDSLSPEQREEPLDRQLANCGAALIDLRRAARAFLEAASLESMTKAPEYIKAKRRLRHVLNIDESTAPDHRVCRCGHTGSVHDPAEDAPITRLGYAVEGVGRCHGSTDAGGRCLCLDFGRLMP